MGVIQMRKFFSAGTVTSLLLLTALSTLAATNLNSSRSNIYRLIYPSDVVTSSQATSILTDLETATQQSQGRVNLEGMVNQLLTKHGLMTQIKKVIIQPADATHSQTRIILLSNPDDEAQALAVSDEGVPADKPAKGKKTN